jgi:hypothetical protein
MKIRRLSEIDLARIAPLEREEKIYRLRLLKVGSPPHTYNPFRSSLGDILNLQFEIFDEAPYTPWLKIVDAIERQAVSEVEATFNLGVAKALYDFGVERKIRSYRKPITAWPVGYGQSVSYWWNLYTVFDDRPSFMFVDPRISNSLTRLGIKFAFSLMHERIRAQDPDFLDARLIIAQFGKGKNKERNVRIFDANDFELFSVDDLNSMIDETFRLWIAVLEERMEEAKKKPTGTTPMGF